MTGAGQSGEDHQIDVPTRGVTPFPELLRQGAVFLHQGLGFEILQALVHKIQGVVDELGGLFRRHDGCWCVVGRGMATTRNRLKC